MSETTFINPYNFVPLPAATVARSNAIPTHEKFHGYSGRLTVKLETLTRLFIPDRRRDKPYTWQEKVKVKKFDKIKKQHYEVEVDHPHYGKFIENQRDEKIIPAASLKGLLRSVAETLSNSCFALNTGKYKSDLDLTKELGQHHHSRCQRSQAVGDGAPPGLCICCRLFGHVPAEEKSTSQDLSKADQPYKGRVTFYDAVLQNPELVKSEAYALKELSSPKVKRGRFYLDAHGEIRGRKFYYHFLSQSQQFNAAEKNDRNCTIHECVAPQAAFKFQIHFENLTGDELGLLLRAILLNGKQQGEADFMAHKIGMAKPLGFGSAHLSVEDFSIFENDAAYLDFAPVEKTNKTLQELLDGYQPDPFPNSGDTYAVWKFPRTPNASEVHYPKLDWFKAYPDHQLPANGELPALGSNGSTEGSHAPRRQSSSGPQKTAGATYTIGNKMKPTTPPRQTPQQSPPPAELVVEVINKKKPHFVVFEIAGVPQQIQCTDGLVNKGTKIVVKKQKDGTYKFIRRS